jgi:hypothetical protein
MPDPAREVNRVARTVIEAADPALRPVHRLRRFVVKRVELVGAGAAAPGGERPREAPANPAAGQRRTDPASVGE